MTYFSCYKHHRALLTVSVLRRVRNCRFIIIMNLTTFCHWLMSQLHHSDFTQISHFKSKTITKLSRPRWDGDTLSPHSSLDAFGVSVSAPNALRLQTPSVENCWLHPGTDMSVFISPNRSASQLGKGRRLKLDERVCSTMETRNTLSKQPVNNSTQRIAAVTWILAVQKWHFLTPLVNSASRTMLWRNKTVPGSVLTMCRMHECCADVCEACNRSELFKCPDIDRCIRTDYLCDGHNQCQDWADELNCCEWCLRSNYRLFYLAVLWAQQRRQYR